MGRMSVAKETGLSAASSGANPSVRRKRFLQAAPIANPLRQYIPLIDCFAAKQGANDEYSISIARSGRGVRYRGHSPDAARANTARPDASAKCRSLRE